MKPDSQLCQCCKGRKFVRVGCRDLGGRNNYSGLTWHTVICPRLRRSRHAYQGAGLRAEPSYSRSRVLRQPPCVMSTKINKSNRRTCYGCGRKPARRLPVGQGLDTDRIYCSLKCAARDAISRAVCLDARFCSEHGVWSIEEDGCHECAAAATDKE